MYETTARISVHDISNVIKAAGKIEELQPQQDFYHAGLASVAALTVLLDLEEKFGVSIPDEQFVQCRTAESLAILVQGLRR
jgi:acyl carrier protein